MARFKVTLERIILRTAVVEAESAPDAKRVIREYGVVEAFFDFPEDENEAVDHIHLRAKVREVTQ